MTPDPVLAVASRYTCYVSAIFVAGAGLLHPWPGGLLVLGWGLAGWLLRPVWRLDSDVEDAEHRRKYQHCQQRVYKGSPAKLVLRGQWA